MINSSEILTERSRNMESTRTSPTYSINSQLNIPIIDFNDLQIGDTVGIGGFR